MVTRETLLAAWRQEEAQPFSGWDFSYLEGRMIEEQPPWDYMRLAAARMGRSRSALDMGTGGGERLLSLREHWPDEMAATEGYAPNLALARERLEPLGVQVYAVPESDEAPLPFRSAHFDTVLNRQSGLNPPEVARVLAPGGVFLTQQIHGLWAQDLVAALGASPPEGDPSSVPLVRALAEAGLEIDRVETWLGRLAFTDVGAIVYYLRAVPWMVKGFSVDRHASYLERLHERLVVDGELVFEARKDLVQAHRPR